MIELVELVPVLQRALNPPGVDLFPSATEAEWVGRLSDAFWRARLAGFFPGHREADGEVSPVGSGSDLSRTEQQIIVAYARVAALQNRILNLTTMSRSKAGPVETETQRSAQMLVEMLRQAAAELTEVAATVARTATQARFLDGVAVRTAGVLAGTGWVRA